MNYYFRDQMQNPEMMGVQGQQCPLMNMQGQYSPMMNMQGQQSPMMNMQGQQSPMMNMQGQQSPMMNMQGQQSPMMNMTEPELESLYPETYNIIQPEVEKMCNNMEAHHGKMYCPTKDEMKQMVDKIYKDVENDVEAAVKEDMSMNERQFFGGGRRLLRDFIGALLIGSFIRRRRPFFGYHGFYGGYPWY